MCPPLNHWKQEERLRNHGLQRIQRAILQQQHRSRLYFYMFAHRSTKSARGITESRAVTCSTKTGTVAPFAAAMAMLLTRTRQGVATASPAPSPTVVGLLPCTATHHQFLHHKAVPWLLPRAMRWAMLR